MTGNKDPGLVSALQREGCTWCLHGPSPTAGVWGCRLALSAWTGLGIGEQGPGFRVTVSAFSLRRAVSCETCLWQAQHSLPEPRDPGHRLVRPLGPGRGSQVGSVTSFEQLGGHHTYPPSCAA